MPIVLRPPTESRAALPAQLAALGRARRRVAAAAAGFALVAALAGGALAAGALDAAVHLPPLGRGFALVFTLAAAGVCARRFRAALRLPTDPQAVALELEARFPKLNDALASAVAFLGDPAGGDDRGVSRRLRGAAVRRAERLAERHDFARLVPAGRGWRAFWACAAVAAAAVPLGLWNPGRTQTALVRFADPFGAHPWPAKTRVEIVAPSILPARLPKGDPFDLVFAVRGAIPGRAAVAVRVPGGEAFEEEYPLAAADPKQLPPGVAGGEPVAVVTARLDPSRVPQTFEFRVRANDADTGWRAVAVVPPPRLVPLDGRASPQLRVAPPAYTGLVPVDLPDGAAVVEVPVGTTIQMRAATDVRLAAAALSFQGDWAAVERGAGLAALGQFAQPAGGVGAQLLAESVRNDIPLSLSADGRVLAATFTPVMSGMYALKLTDESGLVGTRLLEFRLTPDPAPAVALVRPAAGRDPAVVVPGAALPVHVTADDRLYAVRRAVLEYRTARDGPVRTLAVGDARDALRALPAAAGAMAVAVRPQWPHFEAEFALPVAAFLRDDGTPVRAGDAILLRAAADDWDTVSVLKEPGRSAEVEIRVASPEAVDAYLQKELAALRPDLLRARDQQRDAAQKVEDVKPQPGGALTPADREKLLAAEQAQRQVRGRIADPRDGLRAKAELLRELARANGLPRSNTTDRADKVADELGRTADRDLAVIDPLLGDARQLAAGPDPAAVPGLLARAGRHQKAVGDGLTAALDLLAEWGGAGEIRGDARMLRDAVLREAAKADGLGARVPPGKPADALTADDRADLDRTAGKLDPLADQANRLLGRATKLSADKDKQAAEARATSTATRKAADALRDKAAALPAGSKGRAELGRQAEGAADDAADAKAAGDRAAAEAEALRTAVVDAGGQALPDDLRRAADSLRANRQGEAATLARSAAARLDRLAAGLVERPADAVPELAKPKKRADQSDDLAGAQDDLRKRAEAANMTADPDERAAELKRLAPEQQKLVERTRELLQRLTRERADDAARDARAALEKMEAARDDLERGTDAAAAQREATNKLDAARDRLDAATAPKPDERLGDEARRRLADRVTALLGRQTAAAAEAGRIQDKVLKDRKWSRPLLASAADFEDRERALAVEVTALADREFADLPVFARVAADATAAMTQAADRAQARRRDALDADPDAVFDPELEAAADARVRRPLDLAARRLQLILDVLKDDAAKAKAAQPPAAPPKGTEPPAPPAGDGDALPPLAQLKALRALQAELNARTAAFAAAHPDAAKLTDEERDDVKELEAAQGRITALFEQLAKLFQPQPPPDGEKP